MRPVTDTHKISRAKLAYMCDAVAAPVCIMMPISSWAAAVSLIIIMIYFLLRKAFSFNEMMECLPEGFKLMVLTLPVIGKVNGSLGKKAKT